MGNDKWKKVGSSNGGFWGAVLPGEKEIVENIETGEHKEIYRSDNQSTGEAVEKGQFTERDVSHLDKK